MTLTLKNRSITSTASNSNIIKVWVFFSAHHHCEGDFSTFHIETEAKA